MPESELLPRAQLRSDEAATTVERDEPDVAANAEQQDTLGTGPSPPNRSASSSSLSTVVDTAPVTAQVARRPSIWQLPFCAPDTSWLHVTNTLVYFLMFCLNVIVNSEAVWPGIRAVDKQYGPMVTPAIWAYYIRDLFLFLWGLAVAAQSLVDHKGWKDGLLGIIGHSWQILWYADSIWLALHVSGSPTALAMAPLFSLCGALAAVGTQLRLAVRGRELHRQLQADGFEGVPPLGYLLFMAPTSLASGWLLLLHCHASTLALQVLTGSQQAAATTGCVCLVLCSLIALPLLLRFRDVTFGLAFTLSVGSVWVSGFSANEDYRPDQLVAFFCALVIGLLTYCIAAGPQPLHQQTAQPPQPQQGQQQGQQQALGGGLLGGGAAAGVGAGGML